MTPLVTAHRSGAESVVDALLAFAFGGTVLEVGGEDERDGERHRRRQGCSEYWCHFFLPVRQHKSKIAIPVPTVSAAVFKS